MTDRILITKQDNSKTYDKALLMIPTLEETFSLDLSEDCFANNTLPLYFFINVYGKGNGNLDYEYNFETEFGPAKIVIEDVETENEVIIYDEVVSQLIGEESC